LVIVLEAVGVLAVAAVGRAPRRLDISGAPRLRPERAQGGGGVERARAHLDVIGLEDNAALARPILLKPEDERLKAVPGPSGRGHHPIVRQGFRCGATSTR